MPLPKPQKDEPRTDFMSRCMENLKDEYKENKQRAAICYNQWSKALSDADMTPTDAMAAEAKRGLAWREEFGRGGTAVGVARARDISNKKTLSPSTIKRMHSYFSRHEVDKEGQGFSPGEEGYPSAGRIAWALWGGDPGQSWARKRAAQLDNQSNSSIVPATGFRRSKMEVTEVSLKVSGSPLEFKEIQTALETRGINSELFKIKNKIENEEEYEKLVKANTLRFVGSSAAPDRHGDVVNARGWNLDNFKKNPVFLWQHNQYEAPIGNSINEFVDDEKGLVMDIFFHGLTEKSAEALMLYNAGVMKGVSVGFRPLELKEMDDDERKDLGMSPFGTYYQSQELLELSAVSIPANPDALLETQKDVASLVMRKLVDEHGDVLAGFKQLTEKLENLEKKLESSEDSISKINSIENRLEIVETKKTLDQQKGVEKSEQGITCDEIEALFADKFKI